MKNFTKAKNEEGITLIALVVTIIILLVLAGVTLGIVLSDGGLIDKTKEAIGEHEKAQEKEKEELGEAAGMMKNLIDGLGSTGGTTPVTPPTPPVEDDTPLVSTVTDTEHEDNKEVQDSLGNPLVIPSGFKYKEGTNVEDGIVIEDANQNQFVWIPVSNIDGDNNASNNNPNDENLIKLKSGEKVEITLGRYIFKNQKNGTASLLDGTPELVQKGSESNSDDDKYKFNWTFVDGSLTTGFYKENTSVGAKELDKFIQSVEDNHGYYLARYEAGSGNGGKPVSKGGVAWTSINQANASAAARKMYEGEVKYTSDLVNSYAWDTAIVYIQAMGNDNYANQSGYYSGGIRNTGATGDEACHIYDMAGNVYEWTTEYSTCTDVGNGPYVGRGGAFNNGDSYAALRSSRPADEHRWQLRFSFTFIFKVTLNAENQLRLICFFM